MEMKKNIKSRISKLQDINDPDIIKYELYSILTTLLLSKEEFKNNKDINGFLNSFDITFKDYVMKTRTLIMAKTLRIVEKSDSNNLQLYKKILKELYLKDDVENSTITAKNKRQAENYMNNILNKYSRNKG